VEISAPPAQPRQWRTATLVACGIVAFQLVVLVIVVKGMASTDSPARAERAAAHHKVGRAEPKRPTLPRTRTRILVLNGNGITGAAAAESDRLLARGYKVSGTGNTAQSYGQSVVLYRPGKLPEAKRLAADEGIPLVGPLDGITLRQLHGAHLVVVLGT
jgi:LytR cell envelope-related transcriptional attenuator